MRTVAKSTDNLADTRRRREARKDELEQRERELLVFGSRVQQLMADVRVTPTSDKPQLQIRQLSQALASEKETLEMREALVKKIRGLKRTKQKISTGIRNAIRRRHSLYSVAGVVDAAGFKAAAADYAKLLDLRKQRDEISVKIKHQLHDESPKKPSAVSLPAKGAICSNVGMNVSPRRKTSVRSSPKCTNAAV